MPGVRKNDCGHDRRSVSLIEVTPQRGFFFYLSKFFQKEMPKAKERVLPSGAKEGIFTLDQSFFSVLTLLVSKHI